MKLTKESIKLIEQLRTILNFAVIPLLLVVVLVVLAYKIFKEVV